MTIDLPSFKALCYADIFDFPLTHDELRRYRIGSDGRSNKRLSRFIISHGSYIALTGRRDLFSRRRKTERYSSEKKMIAQKLLRYITWIPSIQLCALTGGVAARGADIDDDIDILIITSRGWLWTTRLIVTMISDLWGFRRRPKDKDITNKLCFNMYIDTDALTIPRDERDIFSANEIARMDIVYSRNNMKHHWYSHNRWVQQYLPNALGDHTVVQQRYPRQTPSIIEKLCKKFQLRIMSQKRTNEVIQEGYVRFHPNDARSKVIRAYNTRLRKYGVQ